MRFENLIARELPRRFARQGFERLDHPRFPVDQRAVAIEGQGLKVGEPRRRLCARC